MKNRNQVAKSVRENKERHPEYYCKDKACLWRTRTRAGSFIPCPKHPVPENQQRRSVETIS